MKQAKYLLAAAAIFAGPMAAVAQSPDGAPNFWSQEGFYLGFGAGANWNLGGLNSNGGGITSGTGFTIGGAIGYDFIGWRPQLEVGYSWLPVNVNIPGTAITNKVGQLTTLAAIYYDFMPQSVWTPYAGVGAGLGFVDSNSSLGATVFAYSAAVGIGYNVNPMFRLQVEGRYLGTTGVSVNVPGVGTVTGPNQNFGVGAGVLIKFAAAAAPPPPPPPVVAPPSFMVFFDWDRSNLSQQALNTIRQAAAAFKSKGNARITATGHTDTSGPEAYNMALSLRRANAVKDALVREGVPAQAITVIGRGEAGLLVQTADGVREPQNRRVEIVIQ
ncbi:OmpA family protein [Reyranella soli]|uniref:Membrane protein n=1 Tax=Reyranella soli TaxID=1230389 RepID=A0A512NI61_9HYPH|nr:OmpA family protein [Reyranella soli]GEP58630.1 membrane protein [Reyranella soli]